MGFVAPASLTVNNIYVYVTVAGSGYTSAYASLYTVASNGDLTLVGASASSTSWLTSTGRRGVALAVPVAITAGTSYAVGIYGNQGVSNATYTSGPVFGTAANVALVTQPFQCMQQAATTTSAPASITFASLSVLAAGDVYVELGA